MDHEGTTFRFVDLFAGLGGFHKALEGLGGRAVFAAEWEPKLNALYERNYRLRPWADINALDSDSTIAREVPDHEVLAAGFPCQPFSKAGDQLGFTDTSQGSLFFKVHQILKVKKPPRLILENVPNILRHDKGRTEQTIKTKLEDLGYDVRVGHFSPHELGIPQVRDRAYFIGSLDGLDGYEWPGKHPDPTDIADCLLADVEVTRPIPELTLRAIDMWGDFLSRTPAELKMPSFPIWSMEFGATYPYEDDTPPAVWERRPRWGLRNMDVRGSFGVDLDGMTISEQRLHIPSHAGRDGDLEFPRWKRTFIRQNREFYLQNRSWIDPWLLKWRPQELASSFQKLEWNAQGEKRDIDNFVLQVRASGIRVKRPTTAPSLIAFTQTQVPILGANLGGQRRYMTPAECAKLQSIDDIELPAYDLDAYKALGNAVNAKVVAAIAKPLVDGVHEPTAFDAPANPLHTLGATA
jgi:DNA (cytosine-5)-methyltransferase 1